MKEIKFTMNHKIRKKLLLIFLWASLFPIVSLGIQLFYKTTNQIEKQHTMNLQLENNRVKSSMFNLFYLATNISEILFHNEELQLIIGNQFESKQDIYERYRKFNLIDNFENSYTEIASIKVYCLNDSLITNGDFIVVDDQIKQQDWYQLVMKSKTNKLWIYDKGPNTDSSISLCRKVFISSLNDYAIIRILMSDNYINLVLNNDLLNNVLTINDQTIFYSQNRYEQGETINQLIDQKCLDTTKECIESSYHNQPVLLYIDKFRAYSANTLFSIITIDNAAVLNLKTTKQISIFMILLCITFPAIIILIFSIRFSRRVDTLRQQMKKVANGDLDIIDSFQGEDELTDLFEDIKKTIIHIKQLSDEIYGEKLQTKELENMQQKIKYEMLTRQINPHFLYNTLETIRMKLVIKEDRECAQLVKQLGQLMRHNLENSDSLVTLSSELEYLRAYMSLQIARFEDKVKYMIEVSDKVNVKTYLILPLLLQPVVENSLIHGAEGMLRACTVHISIDSNDRQLIIVVQDNGKGIPEESLRILQRELSEDTVVPGEHIGLYNVAQRIKLFYGKDYGLMVDSIQNLYTKVTMYLPINGEDRIT